MLLLKDPLLDFNVIIIIMILSDKDIKKSIKKKELIFYPKLPMTK